VGGSARPDRAEDLEIISPQSELKEENLEEVIQSASEAPVVKIVNSVLLAALDKKASHVHIVPREDAVEIKLRTDGYLETLVSPPREYSQNIVNRLKVLGGIDILQRRVPLEGYFRVRSEDQFYDIDVATFPMLNGEQVVLTFQQPFSKEDLRLENLGMTPEMLETYRTLIRVERGLILVSGPPDSGKTSTIYATLNALKSRTGLRSPMRTRSRTGSRTSPGRAQRASRAFLRGRAPLPREAGYRLPDGRGGYEPGGDGHGRRGCTRQDAGARPNHLQPQRWDHSENPGAGRAALHALLRAQRRDRAALGAQALSLLACSPSNRRNL